MFSSAPLSMAKLRSNLASMLSIQWIVIDCSMICLGWEYQQKSLHKIWWKLSPYRETSFYKHSISSKHNGADEVEFTSCISLWHMKCISLKALGHLSNEKEKVKQKVFVMLNAAFLLNLSQWQRYKKIHKNCARNTRVTSKSPLPKFAWNKREWVKLNQFSTAEAVSTLEDRGYVLIPKWFQGGVSTNGGTVWCISTTEAGSCAQQALRLH